MGAREAVLRSAAAPVDDAIDGGSDFPVTITGCVERDRQTFWLKNASGPGVQKTRSWKSAFFRKRASAITLIDATDTLGLETYIGQRVSATGTLLDGELRPQSLQPVSDSCN
jgi:hypothetical protein